MPSAINWFQIPAADIARARTFYETICGVSLEKLEVPSPVEMWACRNGSIFCIGPRQKHRSRPSDARYRRRVHASRGERNNLCRARRCSG